METLLDSSSGNQSDNAIFLDAEERVCEERKNKDEGKERKRKAAKTCKFEHHRKNEDNDPLKKKNIKEGNCYSLKSDTPCFTVSNIPKHLDAGKERRRKAAKTCKSEHHRKNEDNDPLKKKNIKEGNCYSLKSDTPCFMVSNIPKHLVYVDVKKYIEYYCGPFHNLKMLKDIHANFIGVVELTFDDCVQAAKILEGKEIAGNILSVTVTGVDSDSDDEKRSNHIEPPMKKKQAHSLRGSEPDVWAKDPTGLYGLEPTFLQSLGIAPPLQQWVHVSNFRCDRLELKEVFDLAGNVLVCSVNMLIEKYAMIMYSHPLEAVQAISMLNGQKLYGNALKISMCKPPANSSLLPKSLSSIGPGLGSEDRPLKDIVQQYERFLCGRSNVLNPIFFIKPVNNEKDDSNINKITIPSTDSDDRPTVKNEPSTGVKTEIVDDNKPLKSEDETPSDDAKSDSVVEAMEAIRTVVKNGVAPGDFVCALKTLLSQSLAQMLDGTKYTAAENAVSSESAGSNASGNHPNVCFSPTKNTTTPTYIQTPTATVNVPERNVLTESVIYYPRNAVVAVRPPNAPVFRPRSTLQCHPNIQYQPQRIAGVGTVAGVQARSNASFGSIDAPIPHLGPANDHPRYANVIQNSGPGFHNNPTLPPFNRNTMLTAPEQSCTLQIVNVPSSTTINDLYDKLQRSPDITSINFTGPGSVLVQFSNRPIAEYYFRILFHILATNECGIRFQVAWSPYYHNPPAI